MEMKTIVKKAIDVLKKYRYAVIILLIGIVLMMLPAEEKDRLQPTIESLPTESQESSVNQQLAEILSQVSGAGNVHVMLTVGVGEEIIYQCDDNVSVTGDSSTTQIETVIVASSNKDQNGLIRQVNPPKYLGAIVVCQGADKPSVQLAIVDAVAKVTGLGADRIAVLKMK